MIVYKFGGASVKDAPGVENLAKILKTVPRQDIVVVVSAMGKMTNAFEELVSRYRAGEDYSTELKKIKGYHDKIVRDLKLKDGTLKEKVEAIYKQLETDLTKPPTDNADYDYDQLVCYGELLSTQIVSEYLKPVGLENTLVDAREIIRTNNTYREANVKWERTAELVNERWNSVKEKATKDRAIMITQGFIGHTKERRSTTLGREGSDFSAAVLAYVLDAESLSIWKDVPGVLNADPKHFPDAVKLKRISYREAIELAYFGASVIHPKTIKPLQNKNIPLYVRPFQDFEEEGTIIEASTFSDSLIPSYIFKKQQILISFTPRDFSFVAEHNLSELFGIFADNRIKINLMQNSALNFSVCVDCSESKLQKIINQCKERYEVLYNESCELVTIRHYDQETVSRLLIGKKVLVEQRSRSTVRMVLQSD